MAEATLYKDGNANTYDFTAVAALSAGEVIQLPDGRAGVVAGQLGFAVGDIATAYVSGQFTVAKTASVVVLPGGGTYWDRSANTATPLKAEAGADFYLGVCPLGAASAATTLVVDLNVKPSYTIDMQTSPGETAVVLTSGAPYARQRGGTLEFAFDTTAEAQKLDWLSSHSVPIDVPFIFEANFEVVTAADADVADFNIGMANATHASDADSITESVFFHNDSGADLNLDAESDDGTTEVAATDTTVDLVAGTPVEVWIDGTDTSDCHMYVNGVEVLASTTFDISAATGPLKMLAILEKTSNDTAGTFRIHKMAVRTPDVTVS